MIPRDAMGAGRMDLADIGGGHGVAAVSGSAGGSGPAPVAPSTAGRPLDPGIRGAFEARFNRGLGHVRVRDDPQAAAEVRRIGALAATHGVHMAFAPGMYDPNSFEGRQLLAHELAHVVQQSGGSTGGTAADTETEANRAASSILRSAGRVAVSATSAPAVMADKKPPVRGPRGVSVIVISLASETMEFYTDAGTFAYPLIEPNVEVGEYTAQVNLNGHGEAVVLHLTLEGAPPGKRFEFNYSIAEGQANPATFFGKQRSVQVSVREEGTIEGGRIWGAHEEKATPPAPETVGPSATASASAQEAATSSAIPVPEPSGVPIVTITDLVQLQKLKQRGLLDAKAAARIEGRIESAEVLTFEDAIDFLSALQHITDTGSPQDQMQAQQSWAKWARFVKQNKDKLTGTLAAGPGGRTIEEVEALIAKHGGYATVSAGATTESTAYDLERAKSWNDLASWEKDLWKELARLHPEMLSTDASASQDLHLYASDLMRMGLRISPRYIKGGSRQALEDMFNDPWFWVGVFAGVMLYISAWVMPEPIISKAAAASFTTALLIVFSLTEIKNLVVAWINLMDETRSARTLKAVETAAEHFGKAIGGTIARVLVYLIQLVGGKLLPTPIPPSGGGGLLPAPAAGPAVGSIPVVPAAPAISAPVSVGGFGGLGPTHMAMTAGPKGTDVSEEPAVTEPKGGGKKIPEGEPAKASPEEAPVDYSRLSNEQLRTRALNDPRAAQELIGRESGRTGGRRNIEAPVALDRLDALQHSGRLRGDVSNLRKRLESPDKATRIGAEAELTEFERELARGKSPAVRGAEPGTDQPTFEVKARTEPFTSQKNAQNFFNDRVKAANQQFVNSATKGEVRINLGQQNSIQGKPIDQELLKRMVADTLSKGGRGSNITKVVVVRGDGSIVYEGLGE
ncbi:uncharacterized protein DUF4157 [Kribbella orskensis]|uniref:Uncharacterized protein DUF4157 n=1 Tax=Kribbella orskensis TaxID=2512216 RepID=A0ABY2B9W4_9ACTN|nr:MULTISPECIES: DUF4157 domain-containing protein [Kribbella]TCN32783.1 uncharacterized protein DUF4157 [Kribbella sp. VKM Ac-2500]TCO12899.1 uncharacterized protein DUF4157 [Kribbella orskensis]